MFHKKSSYDERPLNITIVGCGKVGIALVDVLSSEGNNITLIDKNEKKINDIAGRYDIMTFVGNGASYTVLVDSGIQNADIIIAVTDSDEQNLLCCVVASQMSSCSTIARVRTPDYNQEIWYLRDKLGLSLVINPELECAAEISRILNLPAAIEANSFAKGAASMVSFKVESDSPLIDKKLSEYMQSNAKLNMLFTAAERNGITSIPNGDYVFSAGDTVSFVSGRNNLFQTLNALGINHSPFKKYLLIGGGRIAYYLANQLQHIGVEITIIEKSIDRCKELARLLPSAVIINGDGSDVALLNEEGLHYADAIVALTDIDEINIMLTLYAKTSCDAKVVTKISHDAFPGVVEGLDLGSTVYPRRITKDLMLRYVRAKRVAVEDSIETLYHMFNNQVEAIEFNVGNVDSIVGKPLSQLPLKDNVIIAFIQRKGKIILPKGSDTIEPGDSVMIVTTNFGYNDILDIIR